LPWREWWSSTATFFETENNFHRHARAQREDVPCGCEGGSSERCHEWCRCHLASLIYGPNAAIRAERAVSAATGGHGARGPTGDLAMEAAADLALHEIVCLSELELAALAARGEPVGGLLPVTSCPRAMARRLEHAESQAWSVYGNACHLLPSCWQRRAFACCLALPLSSSAMCRFQTRRTLPAECQCGSSFFTFCGSAPIHRADLWTFLHALLLHQHQLFFSVPSAAYCTIPIPSVR